MNASAIQSNHPAIKRAVARLFANVAAGQADKIHRAGESKFVVISGTSGNHYLVDTKLMTCDCRAGSVGRICRHRVAALGFEKALTARPMNSVAALRASGRLVETRDRRGRVTEVRIDGNWSI